MSTTKLFLAMLAMVVALSAAGCSWELKEIRGKTQIGPEFRDKPGRKSEVRWTTVDQEFDFKWNSGWSTVVSYRRRDVDEGSGGNDNRILVGMSYPIWKRPQQPEARSRRMERLERRVTQLEEENKRLRQGREHVTEGPVDLLNRGGTK